VEPAELLELRADVAAGRGRFDISDGTFSLAEHEAFLAENAESIAEFRAGQAVAFDREREAWELSGEFSRAEAVDVPMSATDELHDLPDGAVRVDAPFVAHVWKVAVSEGQRVTAGEQLLSLEAMKMEASVTSPVDGIVTMVRAELGQRVSGGQTLAVVVADPVLV
jgi:urea carboxylase